MNEESITSKNQCSKLYFTNQHIDGRLNGLSDFKVDLLCRLMRYIIYTYR